MMSNAPNASGLSGTSAPPATAASIVPSRIARSASPRATEPEAQELAVDRIGPRTSSAIPRLAGAAPPNTASARFGATLIPSRGSARAAPPRRRSAERRIEIPICSAARHRRLRRSPAPREPARDEAELAEPVELAGGLRRHPGERIEVVDLGGDLAPEGRRVETVDPLDRGDTPSEAGAEGVDAGPDRGDQADPGDHDAAAIVHAGVFVEIGSAD
jgi:hypothetical protein